MRLQMHQLKIHCEESLDKTVESSTKVIGRFINKTKTHCFTKKYYANLKGGGRWMEPSSYTKRLVMHIAVFLELLSNYIFLKL